MQSRHCDLGLQDCEPPHSLGARVRSRTTRDHPNDGIGAAEYAESAESVKTTGRGATGYPPELLALRLLLSIRVFRLTPRYPRRDFNGRPNITGRMHTRRAKLKIDDSAFRGGLTCFICSQ